MMYAVQYLAGLWILTHSMQICPATIEAEVLFPVTWKRVRGIRLLSYHRV
jgi:hypothetical protein